ncbi:nuclear RNA export factor 1-like [Amia ocellicauda]|uniref:nuclear RNA export factor 1-like n=1 Tax=Amia ocellicauda TaxID=2972642 RepID=UPI003463FC82
MSMGVTESVEGEQPLEKMRSSWRQERKKSSRVGGVGEADVKVSQEDGSLYRLVRADMVVPIYMINLLISDLLQILARPFNLVSPPAPPATASWFHLQKQTRQGVVALLSELPKTQHDPSSFVVDVHTSTKKIVSFTVTGVFKEVNEKSGDSVRMFSRTFITVPAANSGLCIVNDELFVQNAKPEMIRRAFATLAPPPPSSSVPRLTAKQQKMLSIFSTRSCMNLEWSQKCLQDNAWDFNRASQIFTQLKAQRKIPDVAFK